MIGHKPTFDFIFMISKKKKFKQYGITKLL